MSKKEQTKEEEQINELEKIIDRYYHPHVLATDVYNAGYRKESEGIKDILSTIKNYCIKRYDCFAELRNKNLKAHINDNALFDLGQMDFANCLLDIVNELSEKYGVDINVTK